MGFLEDLLPIFKKHALIFVDKKVEKGELVSFRFRGEESFNWKPGQHGIFKLENTNIKKPSRSFSIASTPDEENILISMRIPAEASEYKKALLELKEGDRITMRGPIGPFHIDNTKPILMIAAGIGITPFRALIKSAVYSENKPEAIKLLYIDSRREYLYESEFNQLKQEGMIDILYLSDREELYAEISKYTQEFGNQSDYFVAGPRTMVTSAKAALKTQGIKGSSIKSDLFIGY